ncbi:carbohydrate kinase family protein [Paenibacillus humicola]|uniref:carbohydrate kinase family protein n=1 Tax=Paenibacillus humicola TaxID=3110540 RepID=UPI00237B0AA2|nr:sugar kinase [Paenibacillus humicola]
MRRSVVVLGELNVDFIVTGKDVTPEWNREKTVDSFRAVLGSSSAITACGLAGLGLDVSFVSVVGDDSFGAFCIERLQAMGVRTDFVKADPALQTGVTLSLSDGSDRALLTYMGAIPHLAPDYLPEDLFDRADHIHFGSYYLQTGMKPHWNALFAEARKRGVTTSFDTGWDPDERFDRDEISRLLEHTDMFIPSEDELLHIWGAGDIEQADEALSGYGGMAAVKRGARGAMLLDRGKRICSVQAYNLVPVDTTGAGDSFNAGLIYGRLTGKTGRELLLFASACGAMATQRIGGASSVPDAAEVEAFMSAHSLRAEG